MNFNKIFVIFISICFLGFLLTKLPKFFKSKEKYTSNSKNKIYLFKANWCGHCHKFIPEFEKFQKELEKNKSDVDVQILDADDKSPEIVKLFEKYDVKGFPTVVFVDGDNNKFETYDGDRNTDALMKFYVKFSK